MIFLCHFEKYHKSWPLRLRILAPWTFCCCFSKLSFTEQEKNFASSPTRTVTGATDFCIFASPRKTIFLKLKHNRFPSFANKIFRHVGECVGRPLWPHYRKIASLLARIPEDPTTIKKKFKRNASLYTKDTARQACFWFINQVLNIIYIGE